MKAFPGASFTQAYGMTELAPVATLLSPADHDEPACCASAGRAGAARRGAGRRPGRRRGPAPGSWARSSCRGGHVMLGYWNQPEETAAALRGGWMHTGDGGYMDDRRLPVRRRPDQGHDHHRRRERLLGRGRERRVQPPGRGPVRRHRRARPRVGRARARRRRAAPRRGPDRRGPARARQGADRRLQAPRSVEFVDALRCPAPARSSSANSAPSTGPAPTATSADPVDHGLSCAPAPRTSAARRSCPAAVTAAPIPLPKSDTSSIRCSRSRR